MKAIFPVTVGLLLAGQAYAQPSTKRSFDVHGFDHIDLAGCDRVIVVPGQPFAVSARGTTAVVAATSIETRGTTLTIRPLRNRCSSSHGVSSRATITVTMPSLAGVTVSGAGAIEASDVSGSRFVAVESGAGSLRLTGLNMNEARFTLSGGSHLTITGAAVDRLSVDADGAGGLSASGHARALDIHASGAAQIDTRSLASRAAAITADGAAVIRSTTAGPAAITARGASHVTVDGHPACTIDRSGPAQVHCG